MGRTNMRYPYPEAGGISQPQRAAGQPLPFTTEKHTGSGIEPGVSDCEATVFPRRHCTPLSLFVWDLGFAACRLNGTLSKFLFDYKQFYQPTKPSYRKQDT